MGARMVMNMLASWFQSAALKNLSDEGFVGGGVGVEGGSCCGEKEGGGKGAGWGG